MLSAHATRHHNSLQEPPTPPMAVVFVLATPGWWHPRGVQVSYSCSVELLHEPMQTAPTHDTRQRHQLPLQRQSCPTGTRLWMRNQTCKSDSIRSQEMLDTQNSLTQPCPLEPHPSPTCCNTQNRHPIHLFYVQRLRLSPHSLQG